MSAARPVERAAIVGCGRISVHHIAALEDIDGVGVAAVCDLDESAARGRAGEHGIARWYTDVATMLRETTPDVVHILTPPASHRALVELVAQHGAHVYIEKPLASNLEDARAIAAAVSDAGVSACVGHSRLYDPPFLEALDRIDDGQIGRVVSVRAEQGFTYEAAAHSAVIPWSYHSDWGIFENLMPHPLSVVCHFLEDPGEPQVASLDLGAVREAAVDELRILIPSRSALGEVSLSLATSPEVNLLEIVGTSGRLLVDFNALSVLVRRDSELPSIVTRFTANLGTALSLSSSALGVAVGIATGRVKRYMGLRQLVTEFYDRLARGEESPVPVEDGVLVMRLMEQIQRAGGRGARPAPVVQRAGSEAEPPTVLVTGATGFLGSRLTERLSRSGAAVRATTRLPSRSRPLPGVSWTACDLADEESVAAALGGVETVYHCAAMAGAPGTLADYNEANVAGTMRLLRLAERAGVSAFVYVSTISVYAQPEDGSPYVDESTPYDDRADERGVYTQSKLQAEQAVLAWAREHDAPRVVVLRPGTIYGPGGALPVGRIRLLGLPGRPVIAGGSAVPMPLTHVDNLVDAMLAAGESQGAPVRVYDIVDSAETDQADVARALAAASAGRIRPVMFPYPIVWSLMLGLDLLEYARHRKLGTARYRLRRSLADMRFRSAAARTELGWEPRVGLEEGLAEIVTAPR